MWYNVNMNSTGQSAGAQDGSDTRMPAISDWVAGALLGCETLRIPGRRRQRQTPLLQEYQLYLCSHGATIEQVAQITGTSINRVARATHLYPNAGQPARMEDYNPHTYPEQSGGEYITAYCFGDAIYIAGTIKLPPLQVLWQELEQEEQAVARDAVRLLDCAEGMIELGRDAERIMLTDHAITIQAEGQTLSRAARAELVQLRADIQHLKDDTNAEQIIKQLPRRLADIGCTPRKVRGKAAQRGAQ